jgi:hypothetical protein
MDGIAPPAYLHRRDGRVSGMRDPIDPIGTLSPAILSVCPNGWELAHHRECGNVSLRMGTDTERRFPSGRSVVPCLGRLPHTAWMIRS